MRFFCCSPRQPSCDLSHFIRLAAGLNLQISTNHGPASLCDSTQLFTGRIQRCLDGQITFVVRGIRGTSTGFVPSAIVTIRHPLATIESFEIFYVKKFISVTASGETDAQKYDDEWNTTEVYHHASHTTTVRTQKKFLCNTIC